MDRKVVGVVLFVVAAAVTLPTTAGCIYLCLYLYLLLLFIHLSSIIYQTVTISDCHLYYLSISLLLFICYLSVSLSVYAVYLSICKPENEAILSARLPQLQSPHVLFTFDRLRCTIPCHTKLDLIPRT